MTTKTVLLILCVLCALAVVMLGCPMETLALTSPLPWPVSPLPTPPDDGDTQAWMMGTTIGAPQPAPQPQPAVSISQPAPEPLPVLLPESGWSFWRWLCGLFAP